MPDTTAVASPRGGATLVAVTPMSMHKRHEEVHTTPFFVRFLEAHHHSRGPTTQHLIADPHADEGPLREAAEGEHAAQRCPSELDG